MALLHVSAYSGHLQRGRKEYYIIDLYHYCIQ